MHQPTLQPVSERSPLAEMLSVALPTVVTMSSVTVMQFTDSLMVSRIGPDPVYVAAQGNGGMANWVLLSLFFGATSVINTYVSQNIGAGRPEKAAAYAWTGGWLALAYWPVLLLGALLMPWIFSHLGHDPRQVALESQYAQILLVAGVFKLLNKGFSEFFFGVHRPAVVTLAVVAGNLANVVLNYVLIFGRVSIPALEGAVPGMAAVNQALAPLDDRLPALGVQGAALATAASFAVEFVVQQSVFMSRRYHREFQTRTPWRFRSALARDVVRLGWPTGLQLGNETVCWWVLTAYLLGAAGEAQAIVRGVTDPAAIDVAREVNNAAGWIALRYMHAAFMPAVGLSIAVTAIVGKNMGAGRPDLAAARAWLGLKLAMAYLVLCGLLFVVLRTPMMELFIDEASTPDERALLLEVGAGVMIAAALFQVGDALGIILIGALRGAGDTAWPGLVTVVLSWVILVGGGFATIELWPGLGSLGPWLAGALFITVLGVAMLWRFLGGRWKSIRLVEPGHAPGASPSGGDAGAELSVTGDPLAGAKPGI
jgi:MATE family multidrug resistance protein